jgi:hypothetical protein
VRGKLTVRIQKKVGDSNENIVTRDLRESILNQENWYTGKKCNRGINKMLQG